jgi:hypothetical protein
VGVVEWLGGSEIEVLRENLLLRVAKSHPLRTEVERGVRTLRLDALVESRTLGGEFSTWVGALRRLAQTIPLHMVNPVSHQGNWEA